MDGFPLKYRISKMYKLLVINFLMKLYALKNIFTLQLHTKYENNLTRITEKFFQARKQELINKYTNKYIFESEYNTHYNLGIYTLEYANHHSNPDSTVTMRPSKIRNKYKACWRSMEIKEQNGQYNIKWSIVKHFPLDITLYQKDVCYAQMKSYT